MVQSIIRNTPEISTQEKKVIGEIMQKQNTELKTRALFKVSYADGSRPIEVLAYSIDDARKQYARYKKEPIDLFIGYNYLRIKPVGMI
jgi:hypothetical protein